MGRKCKRRPADTSAREVRPLRTLIAVLLVASAAAVIVRLRFEQQRPTALPPLISEVRAALALEPVQAAEAEILAKPADDPVRLRLAEACEQTRDPVGAALALFPLRGASPELASRFARACIRADWLDEAAQALPASAPAAARLELAAARVLHGQRVAAMSLLEALERENGRSPLRPGDWLDGAMLWVQCRRPARAVGWAQRGVKEAAAAGDGARVFAARLLLGRCLLAARRAVDALDVLPVEAAGETVAEFWRARAEILSPAPGTRRAGMLRMTRIAALEPENGAAAFEAGRALLAASQPERAIPLLHRAAGAPYQEPLCWDLLSRAYAVTGRKAAAAWMRGRSLVVRGRFTAGAAALREAARLDPKSAPIRLDLARALVSVGRGGADLQEALAALDEAEELVGPKSPEQVDAGVLRASVHFQSEHVELQLRALEAAGRMPDPRAAGALFQLGKEYYSSQQFDRAVEVLEKALARGENAHAHLYLGLSLARKSAEPPSERAVRHLLRAVVLQPDLPLAWPALAAELQRMGYAGGAAACLRRSIRWDPDLGTPYLTLARLLLADGRVAERQFLLRAYEPRKDRERLRAAAQLRADRHAADPAARFAYGELLLREGLPEKALKEFLVASSLRPPWREARERLADACVLLDYADLDQQP